MYHHVSPSPGLVTVSPATFDAHMALLARHGWTAVGCDDLAAHLQGRPLRSRSVLITFDDGYLDNWVYAHPILARHRMRAVLFLVTGWIGEGASRGHAGVQASVLPATPSHKECMAAVRGSRADAVMLRWDEVRAMRAAGTFELHSHTHTHTRWDQRLPAGDERLGAMREDLLTSRRTLAAQLGIRSHHLCWPQGYFEPDYQALADEEGFSHLYTTERGTVTGSTDRRRIPRIVVKDRAAVWFGRRLWIYTRPWAARVYGVLRKD
jgi:peptidoglycan/xylan/chitin deacetylase (PgdA/CDA1 family)